MGLRSRKGWGGEVLRGVVMLIAHDYAWKEYEDASSDGLKAGWRSREATG